MVPVLWAMITRCKSRHRESPRVLYLRGPPQRQTEGIHPGSPASRVPEIQLQVLRIPEAVVPAMPAFSVDKLTKVSKAELRLRVKDETGCVICDELFKLKDRVLRLPCDHEFHTKCISNWLDTPNCRLKPTCPLCRADLQEMETALLAAKTDETSEL